MAAVSLLAPPPSIGHASTVLEWLGLLDLLELEGKFLGYSLKKISTLWDIELTSVRTGTEEGGVAREGCGELWLTPPLMRTGCGGGATRLQEETTIWNSRVTSCSSEVGGARCHAFSF